MNLLLAAASGAGFATVLLGAFGAHGLEGVLSAKELDWWETATLYGLTHTAVAAAIGLVRRPFSAFGGWAMLLGVIIFSGTLYSLALGAPSFFGAITPIGGVGMLVGWSGLFMTALRWRTTQAHDERSL
ncbi:MAG: DUF423 domain-containing protein [Pseudomonadota bacterium]